MESGFSQKNLISTEILIKLFPYFSKQSNWVYVLYDLLFRIINI